MRKFLFLVVIFFLANPCINAQDSSGRSPESMRTQHTPAKLRRIIKARQSDVKLSNPLTGYPLLKNALGSLRSNGKPKPAPLKVTTRALDSEHLLIQIRSEDQSRDEVITYDPNSRVYRRWELRKDKLVSEWVGIGDANASKRTDSHIRNHSISWSRVTTDDTSAVCRDSIQFNTLTGQITLKRETVEMLAGEVKGRETLTTQGRQGNFSKFEEPYQRLAARRKKLNSGSFWERMTGKKQAEEHRFQRLNFVFRAPEKSYSKVDISNVNPDISLAVIDRVARRTIFLIAEPLGSSNLPTAAFIETIRSIAANSEKNGVLTPTSEFEKNGIQFSTFSLITNNTKGTIRVFSMAIAGDVAYQVITQSMGEPLAVAKEFHLEAVDGFDFIDRSVLAKPSLVFESVHYGVRVNTKKQDQLGAIPIRPEIRLAQNADSLYGLTFVDSGELILYALDLEGTELDDEFVTRTLANKIGLEYPGEVVRQRPIEIGNASGIESLFVAEFVSGDDGSYVVRLLRNDEQLIFAFAFVGSTTPKAQKLLQERLDALEFFKPQPQPDLPESEKNAFLINALGVSAYAEGQNDIGIILTKLARSRRPGERIFASNYAYLLNESGKSETAVEAANVSLERFPNESRLLSVKASALKKLRRYTEAIETLELLRELNSGDEDLLFEYADTLIQVGRVSDAADAYEQLVEQSKQPSINVRREFGSVLQSAERFEEAIKIAKELISELPDNVQLKEDLIGAYVEASRAPDALREVEKLIKAQMASANCRYLQGRAYLIEKRYTKAKQSFEAGLKLAPGDPVLLDAITATSAALGEGDNSSIKQPIEVVAIPDAVQEAIDLQPEFQSDPGFNYQFTNQVTGVHFANGEPFRKTQYRECLVHNQAGVDSLKKLQFRFDPAFEQIYVNELQIIDSEGNVTDQRKVEQFYLTSADSYGMATNEKYLNVPVSGLKPGNRLRYVYTTEQQPESSIPFTQNLLVGISPSGMRCVFVSGQLDNLIAKTGNGEFQTVNEDGARAWILPRLSTLHFEDRQPKYVDFMPYVWFGSTQNTWKSIGEDYLQRIRQTLEQTTEATALAKKIVTNSDQTEDRARAILKWIQNEIVYQALEFGVHRQIPNSAAETIRNRFGDCKDLSLLAFQMLRAQGIRSHLCLVNTEGQVRQSAPDISQFDHVILYLPEIQGGTFVDCTSRFLDPFQTASSTLSEMAVLIVDPDNIGFKKIPSDQSNDSNLKSHRIVTLNADSTDVLVEETLTVSGNYASMLRSFLMETNASEIKTYLTQAMTDRQRLEIDSYESENVDDFLKPVVMRLKYRVRNLLKIRGTDRQLRLPAHWEKNVLEEEVGSKRMSPFELLTPLRFATNVELRLPEGWECTTNSVAISDSNDWVQYKVTPSWSGKALTLESNITRKTGKFPATEYGKFQDSINLAIDALTPELEFVVPDQIPNSK